MEAHQWQENTRQSIHQEYFAVYEQVTKSRKTTTDGRATIHMMKNYFPGEQMPLGCN